MKTSRKIRGVPYQEFVSPRPRTCQNYECDFEGRVKIEEEGTRRWWYCPKCGRDHSESEDLMDELEMARVPLRFRDQV